MGGREGRGGPGRGTALDLSAINVTLILFSFTILPKVLP